MILDRLRVLIVEGYPALMATLPCSMTLFPYPRKAVVWVCSLNSVAFRIILPNHADTWVRVWSGTYGLTEVLTIKPTLSYIVSPSAFPDIDDALVFTLWTDIEL